MITKSTSLSRRFRNAFLTGLLIFLPLGTTIFVLDFLLNLFKEPVTRLVTQLGLGEESFFFGLESLLGLLGLIVGVLSLTILGFLSNYVLGKFFISSAEKVLGKVPFINTVYHSVKQIVETFGKENRAVFKEVVLVEYPRPDCYVLGFLTNDASGETVEVIGKPLTNVFVPTTPNPTSGFLLMLPPQDIYPLGMSVGEGMKMLISGGAVIPPSTGKKLKEEGPKKPTQSKRRSPSPKKVATDSKKTSKSTGNRRTSKSPPVSRD
ncbi:MAG: DUF502 domain-containing protein [Opitutales bacterium]